MGDAILSVCSSLISVVRGRCFSDRANCALHRKAVSDIVSTGDDGTSGCITVLYPYRVSIHNSGTTLSELKGHIFRPEFGYTMPSKAGPVWRTSLNAHRNPKPRRCIILQHVDSAVWRRGLSLPLQRCKSSRGSTGAPLYVTVEKGHLDVACVLLDHGACTVTDIRINRDGNWTLLQKVFCIDDLGRTPLHLASKAGRARAMQLLLDCGADVNKRMHYGRTPLHLAVCCGNVEAVRLLLQHDANVDEENDGWTALHCASHPLGRSLEIARVVLE